MLTVTMICLFLAIAAAFFDDSLSWVLYFLAIVCALIWFLTEVI